jgi:3-dehydroquinate synthase
MLTIQSRAHAYSVERSANLREAVAKASSDRPTYAIVDSAITRLYAAELEAVPAERRLSLEATEDQKSYEALPPVFKWILSSGFRKDCNLLVVGGGVIQDIGCFVASTLFRGARWEFIPTTLLAQCDSCIGSKSSLNVAGYKNQLGTFYPPHKVHMVNSVLATLPPDEIRSGIGEMIKLALIDGSPAWQKLRGQLGVHAQTHDLGALMPMIEDILRIKKTYIEEDEFDRGRRNILNYGHTFGHAYESATHYAIPHGIAVTLGMATATFVSEKLGRVPKGYFARLDAELAPYYRPFERQLANVAPESIHAALKLDKKNAGGKITCILTSGEGKMEKLGLDAAQLFPLVDEYVSQTKAPTA